MDVLPLRYFLKRFIDISIHRRRILPWKMEVKDLIRECIADYLLKIFVVKLIFGRLRNQIKEAESRWWLIFLVSTIPTLNLFPKLPLDAINREEENMEDELERQNLDVESENEQE